jgi:hypothetical protein
MKRLSKPSQNRHSECLDDVTLLTAVASRPQDRHSKQNGLKGKTRRRQTSEGSFGHQPLLLKCGQPPPRVGRTRSVLLISESAGPGPHFCEGMRAAWKA